MRHLVLLPLLALAACGPGGRNHDPGTDGGAGGDGSSSTGGCTGLQCQVQSCPSGQSTVLTGRLFAPNGKDPVPGAEIYVPANGLPEFPAGVSCDLCSDVSGAAASTQTAFDGTFTLSAVPSGSQIPIVLQLGRFRRVITVDVTACAKVALPSDPGIAGQRLPSKDGELSGQDTVPHIAVATGDYDQIECVLRRMGITQFDLYSDRDPGQPPATVGTLESLLSDAAKLTSYNILVVNCTNNQFESFITSPQVRQNLHNFVAMGGRLYATDWAYDSIEQIPEFAPYLCFEPQGGPALMCGPSPQQPEDADTTVDYSNQAQVGDPDLAKWLGQFPGVIDSQNHVPVEFSFVVVDSVATDTTHFPTKVWVRGDTGSYGVKPMTVTFDYAGCGRVHYSTYNTEPNGTVPDSERYPACKADFSPQERILEYLVFEIATCVGNPG